MVTYLLDTSICIEAMRNCEAGLVKKLGVERHRCVVSDIVVGELLFGFRKTGRWDEARRTRRFLAGYGVVSLGLEGSEAYALLRTDLELRGLVIGANDMLIAATALAHDATLVSRDADFSRVIGLRLEDWR